MSGRALLAPHLERGTCRHTRAQRIYTVLRSPHVNKKSREQFELSSYKRLIDIYSSSSKTVDALMRLELPSGVEVEIKV